MSKKPTQMTEHQRYMRRFTISMVGYVVVLLIMVFILDEISNDVLRIIAALMPVIPVLYGLSAFIKYLRSMDELQRKINFEAFGFSIAVTGVLTFSLGFLEVAGFPTLNLLWVFPMLIAFWGIGLQIAKRRYE